MSGGRGVALMTGAVLVLTGLSLLGLGIVTACRTEEDAATTGAVLIAVGDGLAVAGFVFLWFSLRAAALAGLIAVGAASLPVGAGMVIVSPMVRQLENPDLASERAGNIALAGGFIFIGMGTLLLLLAWLLSLQPGARGGLAAVGRATGIAYGSLLFLGGLGVALTAPFAGALAEDSDLTTAQAAVLLASLAFILLLPGTLLVLHGISAAMAEATGPSWVPPAPLLAAAFGLVLAGGAIAAGVAAVVAPLHLLAAGLPAVGLVGLAVHGGLGWRTAGTWPTWRQLGLAVAFGMAVATAAAGTLEALADGGIILGFLTSHGAFEGARTAGDVGDILDNFGSYMSDGEEMAAALLTLAVVAPVVEEAAKGLGVRVLMTRESSRASLLAIGVAVGGAFGTVEALTYGLSGFTEGNDSWWAVMLVRGGATSMHGLSSGLVGLGWYLTILRRRPWAGVLLYLLAVLIHATWNGLIVLVGTRALVTWEGLSNMELERVLYALVAAMAAGALVGLFILSRRLREPQAAAPWTP